MTTDAARKAVFNTPELLENIVSFLPYTDILTKVQRLSRQWKDVVDSSPAIKDKLWTNFSNATAIQPNHVTNEHSFPQYPLWGMLGMPSYSQAVTFNPVLLNCSVGSLKLSLDQMLPRTWLQNSTGAILHPRVLDFSYLKASGGPYHSVHGLRSSWRDMFLTNPPITTALLHVCNYADHVNEFGPEVIELFVRDHIGLTLGLVHDTLMASLPANVRQTLAIGAPYLGTLYAASQ
jgi:hypothetical protein